MFFHGWGLVVPQYLFRWKYLYFKEILLEEKKGG